MVPLPVRELCVRRAVREGGSCADRCLLLLMIFQVLGTSCRWSDFGAPGRAVPVLPHDERSMGTRNDDLGRTMLGSIEEPVPAGSAAELISMDEPLGLEQVLEIVRRVHPSLDSAEAAWMASRELYPQVTALQDPQIRFLTGPTLFGDASGSQLWRLQGQQRIPWFGKRTLLGEIADQKSHVVQAKWAMAQRGLAEVATDAFLAYAQTEQVYQLAQQQHALEMADLAERQSRSVVHAVGPQEGDEDDLELIELAWLEQERRSAELEESRRRAQRRLNHLLHRRPTEPLPDAWLPELEGDLPEVHVLIDRAFNQRPELAAARAGLREAEYELELAHKNFYPDPEIVGRFDTFADQLWAPDRANIRPQLGVHLYPPVRFERLWARVRQAELEIRSRRAALLAEENKIRGEVQDAYAAVRFSRDQLAKTERMVQLAQQRLRTMESYVSDSPDLTKQQRTAYRKLLAYEIDRTQAEFDVRKHLAKLQTVAEWKSWERSGVTEPEQEDEPPGGMELDEGADSIIVPPPMHLE